MPIFRLCAPFWLFIHYANGMYFTVTVALPKDCMWYATLIFKKTIIVSVTVIAYSGTCIWAKHVLRHALDDTTHDSHFCWHRR